MAKKIVQTETLTAVEFIKRMKALQSRKEQLNIRRYFKMDDGDYGAGDQFIGVKMGQLFALAKEFSDMPVKEIEKLLESPIHEARAGAVSIMDKSARKKGVSDVRRKDLYDLYMNRHDRINNWDLVDLGCLYLVGNYLLDKPHKKLYALAKSSNLWERRTAIVGTAHFIRQGQLTDTFKISEMLLKDKEDLVHKGAGWMLRFAGDKDMRQLLGFLDKHAAVMPRAMLRGAIEKLSKSKKEHYMKMKKNSVA